MYYLKNLAPFIRNSSYGEDVFQGVVRPLMEYCMSVCHFALPDKLSFQLERQQKYASKLLGFNISDLLKERRQKMCIKKFNKIVANENDVLNVFIPPVLKFTNLYRIPLAKTKRVKSTFFYSMPALINCKCKKRQ